MSARSQTASQPKPAGPGCSLTLGLVLILGACWGYYNLYREYRDASASSRWPRAQATILSSTIDEHRAHKGGRTWTNRIRYRYTVDGKAYESEVIRPGGFPSVDTEELAMKVWEKYQVDSIHQASYDPDSPSRAVLEPGVKGALSSLAFGATLATLFLLIPGVFFLWGATRSPAPPPVPPAIDPSLLPPGRYN